VVAVLIVLVSPSAEAANFDGGPGQDLIAGTELKDRIRGFGNIDTLFGRAGRDEIYGDGGDDFAPDFVLGGSGADTMNEQGNQEGVFGRVIDDDGTKGDLLKGGGGDDFLFSLDGAPDKVDCGKGNNDVAVVDKKKDTVTNCETVLKKTGDRFGAFGVVADLNGTNDIGLGGVQTWVFGLKGDDLIELGTNDNWIFPGHGADTVNGDTGNDQIFDDDGVAGDTLNGDAGSDIIYSVDGAADTIACGDSTGDIAIVDTTIDTVTAPEDCEHLTTL
jgi:hypothetical protein